MEIHNLLERKVICVCQFIEMDSIPKYIKSGMTIMVGGFLGVGTPEKIIDKIIESGIKDLTLICNDTAFMDKGSGKLVVNKQIKKSIVSHIGTNAESGRQMIANEMKVDLIPQGTLAEKIRCGGVGLGGVLTKTGIGTTVQDGKTIIDVKGEEYLLETPIRADVAILFASVADEKGNLVYEGSTRNFNPLMAMAADIVIVEAKKIVKAGEISPDNVVTPYIFVDYIVKEA